MILSENKFSVRFSINQKMLDKLKNSKIFTRRTGMSGKIEVANHRWECGDIVEVQKHCKVEPYVTIAAGNRVYSVGAFSSIASPMPVNCYIGRYSSIGQNVKVLGFRHPIEAVTMSSASFNFTRENVVAYLDDMEKKDGFRQKPIAVDRPQPNSNSLIIGNDVWIGSDVSLSGGISIGDGAVIAAGSIVTRDILPYEIVGGVPAKRIRMRFDEAICDALLKSKWWNYELADLYLLNLNSPEDFVDNFQKKMDTLRLFIPPAVNVAAAFRNC